MKTIRYGLLCAILFTSVGMGCQTLKEIANLRNVKFALDRVASAELAGVNIQRIKNYNELSAGDILRLTAAVANKKMPLDFELHLSALNPAENNVQARLVQMDWTLLLDDRETVSGTLKDEIVMPPGEPTDIGIPIRLDLLQFFNEGAQDLVELALAVSGQGGAPKRIKLQAVPTINTPLGPIRYPQAITIVSESVGS